MTTPELPPISFPQLSIIYIFSTQNKNTGGSLTFSTMIRLSPMPFESGVPSNFCCCKMDPLKAQSGGWTTSWMTGWPWDREIPQLVFAALYKNWKSIWIFDLGVAWFDWKKSRNWKKLWNNHFKLDQFLSSCSTEPQSPYRGCTKHCKMGPYQLQMGWNNHC